MEGREGKEGWRKREEDGQDRVREGGTGWQGMAPILQRTKRGRRDKHTEGRRGRSEEETEREEVWLVLTPVIALMYDLI